MECTPDQYHAIKFILGNQDLCVGLRGPAGAGKTFALQQIRWGLHSAGKDVAAIAPSQTAVDELQKVGFQGAMTIAHMLLDQSAQQRLAGKVVILDEASMVSASDMVQVLRLVEKHDARLLFSGDTRQIRAVEAGDGLQTLERHSALQTTSLRTVRRQIVAEYRHAVEMLRARPEKGLDELKEMGAVREVHIDTRAEALAAAYRAALTQKNAKGQEKSVLIVSATHADIEHITDAIRKDRQERGVLGRGDTVERFEALNWTKAQKEEARNFRVGQVLVFHKRTKRLVSQRGAQSVADGAGRDVFKSRSEDRRREAVPNHQWPQHAAA